MNIKKQHTGTRKNSDNRIFELTRTRLLSKIIMATIGKAVLKVKTQEKMPTYFLGQPFEINSLLLTRKWLLFNELVSFFLILFCAAIGYFFYRKGYLGGVENILPVILLNLLLMLIQIMNRRRVVKLITSLDHRKENAGKKLQNEV